MIIAMCIVYDSYMTSFYIHINIHWPSSLHAAILTVITVIKKRAVIGFTKGIYRSGI